MGGSGGDTKPQWDAKNYDPKQIAAFMSTGDASQWSPEQLNSLYTAYGGSEGPNGLGVRSYNSKATPGSSNFTDIPLDLVNTFEGWMKGNQQTQTNWQNYADVVAANEGGQGDNTVTSGDAVGQRQQLLGSLANPNSPGPTGPTPGLGAFGLLMKNGKPVMPGGAK